MREALQGLSRYIVTPRVAKHRLFVWMDGKVFPDSRLYVIAREDDVFWGILHSKIHEIWSLATCSWHGVGNDPTYNVHSCFETFPFPEGLELVAGNPDENQPPATNNQPPATGIAEAAQELNTLRENWLNPPEWTERVPEVVPGFPDRILPKPGHEADLKSAH